MESGLSNDRDIFHADLLEKMIKERERLIVRANKYRISLANSERQILSLGKTICDINGCHDYEWYEKDTESGEDFYWEGKCKICNKVISSDINPECGAQLELSLKI